MPKRSLLLKIIKIGLYVLPVTLLLYWQKLIYPFITLKVFSFQALTEVLFATWLILILFYKQYRPKFTWLTILLLTFMAVLVLASALGVNPHRSFWSTQFRGIGLVAIFHFCALFFILRSVGQEINWRRYFLTIFGISLIAAAFAIIQQLIPSIFFFSGASRPGSFFGNPAYLASFLVFTVFIGLWLAKTSLSKKVQWWLMAASLFEAAVIFSTNTRGAILGLIAGAGLMLLSSRRRKIAWYGLGAMVALGLIIFATRTAPLWQGIPGVNRLVQISRSDTTVLHRLLIWKVAGSAAKDRPLLGWGFENFRSAFEPHYEPTLLRSGFSETFFDKPHSAPLEILVSGGLPAFLLYLSLLVVLVRNIFKQAPADFRSFGLGALGAYVVQNLFVFDTFGSYFMLFVFIAFVDTFSPPAKKAAAVIPALPIASPKSSVLRVVAASLISLVMLYAVFFNVKIIYANNRQYWGLNYLVQSLSEQGIAAFDQGLAISQPYQNELRFHFLQAISQMAPRLDLPNEEAQIEKAITGAKQAIAAEPDNYPWYLALADARTFFQATNPRFLEGAAEEIAQAIALSPNRQQSYYVTAKLAWIKEGIQAAFAEMEKAVNLDPESGDPHFYYGLLAHEAGYETLAVEELEKARVRGRKPQSVQEYKMVGAYYADAEKYELAAEYLSAAASLDQTDIETRLKLGIVYVYMGEPAKAAVYFREVLEKAPEVRASANWPQLKLLFDAAGVAY